MLLLLGPHFSLLLETESGSRPHISLGLLMASLMDTSETAPAVSGGPPDVASASPLPQGAPPQRFLVGEMMLKAPIFCLAALPAVSAATPYIFAGHHNGIVSRIDSLEFHAADGKSHSRATTEIAAHSGVVRQVIVFEGNASRNLPPLLFTCSSDGTIKSWSPSSCASVMTFAHSAPVCCCAVVTDAREEGGLRLYSGDEDGVLKLWSAVTGQCSTTLRCHVGPISSILVPAPLPQLPEALSTLHDDAAEPPRANSILTGSIDTLVKVIDPSTKTVHTVLKAEAPVCSLMHHHPHVYVGCSDGVIRCFHMHSALPTAIFRGHNDGVNVLLSTTSSLSGTPFQFACGAAGFHRFASISDDMSVHVWSRTTWASELRITGTHDRCISAGALVACGPDILAPPQAACAGESAGSETAAPTPASRVGMLTGGFDARLCLWDFSAMIDHVELTSGGSNNAAAKGGAAKKKKGDGKKKKK